MKVPPALNLNPDMNRMSLSFGADMFWRYPGLASLQQTQASLSPAAAPPSSPLNDVKNQMPQNLGVDPRSWTREEVSTFLRWFEKEFELPKIDSSKFCMNGKALCMLNKPDLVDRAPSAGDVLHNTLQFLLKDAPVVPPSPLTPHHPLLSPPPLGHGPPQPWQSLIGTDFHNLGHLLQQGSSVTLSPAPSDQSGGSPRHPESNNTNASNNYHHSSSSTGGSTHSDSEESTRDSTSPQRSPIPPHSTTPFHAQAIVANLQKISEYQRLAVESARSSHNMSLDQSHNNQLRHHSPPIAQQHNHSQVQQQPQSTPIVPGDEPLETGTNGRLLWDFLQQLLNDREQRWQRFITWKNVDTGVFKIVDPPGLARLWGVQKNHLSMNYDKMSRALRYYYRVNILRKVQGERHCYQFLRNPAELKSIKNISLLRGAPVPARSRDSPVVAVAPTPAVVSAPVQAPMEEDEGPTDLSMPAVHSQQQQFSSLPHSSHNLEQEQAQNLSVERTDIKTENFEETHYEQ